MNSKMIKDITDFIFLNDDPEISDVILIPGSSKWEVSKKASELYSNGYAKYIIPSGKYTSKLGRFPYEKITNELYSGQFETDFDFCSSVLRKNGVPESAILCENQSTNTSENAEFSKSILDDRKIKVCKAILCCQAFHARRAFMTYARWFPETVFYVVPSDTQGITSENWLKSEYGIKRVLGELEKCGKYFHEYFTENVK
ncbi:YdcF family protein [Tissierella pigra]|uniref:YdcF family protein n=1 Tax=Tissierella pigra TaxID=2607614 RepID=A0A6N7XV25_9FIRM|nr:YdcF family protein [Tissierella pigra]MSU00335.1 YdcF family protein [Tissierella pigra]